MEPPPPPRGPLPCSTNSLCLCNCLSPIFSAICYHRKQSMKPLEKDELYQNVQQFLKNRGVELKQGSYSTGIEKSCALLSDAINLGQQGVNRAKLEFDKKL